MSFNHGGYDNEDGFGRDRPQKEILFRPETMHKILSDAAATGSHDIGPELMASISSQSNPQRSSSYSQGSRQSPPRSSRQNTGLVNTPPRDSNYGPGVETYRDSEGNLVQSLKDDNATIRVHTGDPEWDSLPRGPSRTNTGHSTHRNAEGGRPAENRGAHYNHSPPPSDGRRSPPVYQTRDREGNLVTQYDGDSSELGIRTHGHEWH